MKKKPPFNKHLSSLVALIFAVLCSSPGAQTYPDKPLRLIVPYTAGGITDSLSRNLAELLRQDFKQPVIVENKPGANTAIGAQVLANSKPDGYTMLFITPATVVTNPLLNSKLAYDPDRDLVVVARFAEIPLLAVVSVDSTIRSLGDLIAQAKAKPGTFNYGSTGTGSSIHLASLLLAERSGTEMVHIPFSGSAPSLAALMTGSTQFTIDPPASSLPLIQGGKLRALAVSSRQRLTALPDVPTIAESGFPGFEASSWAGIVVPANTPKDIVLKLNQAISRASENKEFRAKFEPLGVLFAPSMSPAQIDASVKAEREQWGRIIQANNLKVN